MSMLDTARVANRRFFSCEATSPESYAEQRIGRRIERDSVDESAEREAEALETLGDWTERELCPLQGYVRVGIMVECALRRAEESGEPNIQRVTHFQKRTAERSAQRARETGQTMRMPVTREAKKHSKDTAPLRTVLAMARALDVLGAAVASDPALSGQLATIQEDLAVFRA
jgi:hypothetical protein